MAEPRRVLVLGGTAEGLELAQRLARVGHLSVTYSLAGRTARPRACDAPVRSGGFGGAGGLERYLADTATRMVVDATHPFAERMSRHAFDACDRSGAWLLQLARPAWTPAPGDRWTGVGDLAGAAAVLPSLGRRAFLTTGGRGLEPFAELRDTWFLVRCIEPPGTLPLPRHGLLLDRGPFDAGAEEALMREHRIDVLVTKNAGGTLIAAKLVAARRLGIPVVMVRRPALPPAPRVPDVESAVASVLERTGRTPGPPGTARP